MPAHTETSGNHEIGEIYSMVIFRRKLATVSATVMNTIMSENAHLFITEKKKKIGITAGNFHLILEQVRIKTAIIQGQVLRNIESTQGKRGAEKRLARRLKK